MFALALKYEPARPSELVCRRTVQAERKAQEVELQRLAAERFKMEEARKEAERNAAILAAERVRMQASLEAKAMEVTRAKAETELHRAGTLEQERLGASKASSLPHQAHPLIPASPHLRIPAFPHSLELRVVCQTPTS
jgi:hypothetical protein